MTDEFDSEPLVRPRRKRYLAHRIAMRSIPLIRFLIRLLWKTYRLEFIGEENVLPLVESKTPFIPCYWHGRQFIGVHYMLRLQARGLKTGFLISPSRDGDLAATLLSSLDVHVMRGSATRTGAQAMRQMMQAIVKEKISPIMTPDGPKGPIFEFKPGTIAVAQLTGAPLVPISWYASRVWEVQSWDRFTLPKPFARVVVAVGTPRRISRNVSGDETRKVTREMEDALAALKRRSAETLLGAR